MTYFTLDPHTLIFITFAQRDFRGFFILVMCVSFFTYIFFVLIFMSKLSRSQESSTYNKQLISQLTVVSTGPKG